MVPVGLLHNKSPRRCAALTSTPCLIYQHKSSLMKRQGYLVQYGDRPAGVRRWFVLDIGAGVLKSYKTHAADKLIATIDLRAVYDGRCVKVLTSRDAIQGQTSRALGPPRALSNLDFVLCVLGARVRLHASSIRERIAWVNDLKAARRGSKGCARAPGPPTTAKMVEALREVDDLHKGQGVVLPIRHAQPGVRSSQTRQPALSVASCRPAHRPAHRPAGLPKRSQQPFATVAGARVGRQAKAGLSDSQGVPTSTITAVARKETHRTRVQSATGAHNLKAARSGSTSKGAARVPVPSATTKIAGALRELFAVHATPIPQRVPVLLDCTEVVEPFQLDAVYAYGTTLGNSSTTGVVVRKGTHRTTGEQVAIKEIPKSALPTVRQQETTKREIDILCKASIGLPVGAAVIRLYAVVETAQMIYIVMELAQGGELYDHIVVADGYEERKARQVMRQIFEGLQQLHTLGIIHRDIKADNILCCDEEGINVKIADFGLANRIATPTNMMNLDEEELRLLLRSKCGTPLYMAPEMLMGRLYGTPVDVWSAGIVMYTMLTGSMPFFADTEKVRRAGCVALVSVCCLIRSYCPDVFGHLSYQSSPNACLAVCCRYIIASC